MAQPDDYTIKYNVGDTLDHGKYRLDRFLGHGAFGEVWIAMQVHLGLSVAIKILHWNITRRETRERFVTEARVAIGLGKHDNIVAGRDLIVDTELVPRKETFAIVMEYIDGGKTLRSYLNEWLPTTRGALRITEEILLGLAFAHESGVLHRDIKPENILLRSNGKNQPDTVMITDFGLAGTSHSGSDDNSRLTAVEMPMGTFGYGAYEQWRGGRNATPRSDLYSVGVILAEMVGASEIAATFNTLADSIDPHTRQAWLETISDERIRTIVAKATEIEWFEGRVVERRYASAREMLAAIRALSAKMSEGEPLAIPRPQPAPTAVPADELDPAESPAWRTHIEAPWGTAVPGEGDGEPPASNIVSPAPRKQLWVGAVIAAVALIAIGGWAFWPKGPDPVVAETPVDAPATSPLRSASSEGRADVQLPTSDPVVETPPPIEAPIPPPVVVEEPKSPPVAEAPKPQPVVATKVEPKPPKAEAKPDPPKVTPPPPEPKAETPKATEPRVSIGIAPPSVKQGGVIQITGTITLPEGANIGQVYLRYIGESGGAVQTRTLTKTEVQGNSINVALAASASLGGKVVCYLDLRVAGDAKAHKSDKVTVTITP